MDTNKELDDKTKYGNMIKEIRIKAGLTQGEVASQMNVTPGYISNVEKGRTALSLRLLIFYAKITGVSLDSLVGSLDEEYEDTAIDNDIVREVKKMDIDQKKKLLKIIKILNQ